MSIVEYQASGIRW